MVPMPTKIAEQVRERATRLVLDHLDEYPNLTAACESVARKVGVGAESLRRWVRQAQVDSGQRPGVSSAEQEAAYSVAWINCLGSEPKA